MDYYNINIQQMEYFLAVAKHLNFTDAAKSLYISQPTLSKQIALFEKSINTQLFIRSKRSVSLTPAGMLMYDQLGGVLKSLDDVIEQAKQAGVGYKSRIKIGMLEGLDTSDFLIRSANFFRQSYPDVLISFEKHNFKDLRNLLQTDQLDLGLTLSFEVENVSDFEYREVWETNSCLLMSGKHPKAKEKNLKIEDFKDEPFIMLTRDITPNGYDGILAMCRAHGFLPKVALYVPNLDSLSMCVEANMGVAVTDVNMRLYADSELVRIPLDDDYVNVVACWKKKNTNTALKLFVDMMLEP